MINGKIDDWRDVAKNDPDLQTAFEWVTANLDAPPESGRYEIDGDRIFVNVLRYSTKGLKDGLFETHRFHADLQCVVSGSEKVYVDYSGPLVTAREYNEESDAELFEQPEKLEPEPFTLSAHEFFYFAPNEAHMPGINAGEAADDIVKFVVKIRK